ncbi:MAG TPA: hypothetical protein VNK23_09715 [Candidatus Dormibacteraeota bacterium]|nr:hypothetical protein [Candidatus Dormibacteraeota bacterium]
MKLTGGLLLLFALSLAGCIHATGPCYGVGCHAFTTPSGAKSQASPNQTSQTSQTSPGPASASGAKKSHGIHSLLKKVKL